MEVGLINNGGKISINKEAVIKVRDYGKFCIIYYVDGSKDNVYNELSEILEELESYYRRDKVDANHGNNIESLHRKKFG